MKRMIKGRDFCANVDQIQCVLPQSGSEGKRTSIHMINGHTITVPYTPATVIKKIEEARRQ